MIAVAETDIVSRPYAVAPIADPESAYGVPRFPDATPAQLAEAVRYVIERHRPYLLDRPRCGWCAEPWVCSSVWLAEQIRRIMSRLADTEITP